MTQKDVSVTGKISVTLEVEWPHSFNATAHASDIYTTAARECRQILETALRDAKVRYRIIGEVQPSMIIVPVNKP
jgi:hypothetical protein